jgi:cell wall-associated NlpC family hydrolase
VQTTRTDQEVTMHRKSKFRISPASLLALVALFAALGGTSYAAIQINGKDLKNKSVPGKKLKNKTITGAKVKGNTLTGKQINEAKLGAVPSAVNATNATNAVNATNAANVAGHQRTFKRVTATTGPNATAAISAAPEVELFKAGTLTIYGKCATDTSGPTTYGFVFAKTSQNGATLNSAILPYSGTPAYLDTGTPELGRYIAVATAGPNTAMIAPWILTQFSATGPDGASLGGQVPVSVKNGTPPTGNGPYGDGDVCLFSGAVDQFN